MKQRKEQTKAYYVDTPEEDTKDDGSPTAWKEEPKLFWDDWIKPVEVMRKPSPLRKPRDKLRVRVAKNCLLVTLMFLNAGFGTLIENYQQHAEDAGLHPPALNSTDGQAREWSRNKGRMLDAFRQGYLLRHFLPDISMTLRQATQQLLLTKTLL